MKINLTVIVPTKNDLDVTEKMAIHAYKQLQKAISNDSYYDYIHNKFYDSDNLDIFTRYQISVEKDIPVGSRFEQDFHLGTSFSNEWGALLQR